MVAVEATWRGVLPPPGVLTEYEAILAGIAERLMSLAEQSAAARLDRVRETTHAEVRYARVGLRIALALTVAAFAAVVFFARGNNVAGVACRGMPLVVQIRVFLVRP